MHEASQTRSRDELIPLLQRVELLEGLSTGDLRRVAGVVTGLTLHEGEVVFEAGEPGDACYVVLDGVVEIAEGPDPVAGPVSTVRTGESFGDAALLGDAPGPPPPGRRRRRRWPSSAAARSTDCSGAIRSPLAFSPTWSRNGRARRATPAGPPRGARRTRGRPVA